MVNLREKNRKQERRRLRNRAKIFGTSQRPRFSVFRSNKYTYAQLIDDNAGRTLVSASSRQLVKSEKKGKKIEEAKALGILIGEKALKLGIKESIFNKGRYLYHGRVKAVADGAREAGLKI